MKRLLIQRNKTRQTLALRIYGTPNKPFSFRIHRPRPDTPAHTRRFCKRQQKRLSNNAQVSFETIQAFLRGVIDQLTFQ
jgi:hypothetical protein